jgi:hypothetical protein
VNQNAVYVKLLSGYLALLNPGQHDGPVATGGIFDPIKLPGLLSDREDVARAQFEISFTVRLDAKKDFEESSIFAWIYVNHSKAPEGSVSLATLAQKYFCD